MPTAEAAARIPLLSPARTWVRRGSEPDAVVIDLLETELRLPRALCTLLVQRGFGDPALAKNFLKPRIDALSDPYGLSHAMDKTYLEHFPEAIRPRSIA